MAYIFHNKMVYTLTVRTGGIPVITLKNAGDTCQNKTAIVIYHSFCFIAVFCRYRVSALEGIPYSYVISFHDSFHLIVDTRFIARKDYRIFNIALKACGSSL